MALDNSLFVSDQIHEREVELSDGRKHRLHFRELPVVEFRRFHLAEASGDEDARANSLAKLIAASVVEPDGTPALTVKDAARLRPDAANAILAAILDVNGFVAAKKPGSANAA